MSRQPFFRVPWTVRGSLLGLLLATGGQAAFGAAPSAADAAFFETRVRPVLAERCFSCHSAGSRPIMGGLAVDSRAALLKGGGRGPGLLPGEPAKSLLLTAVRHTDPNLRMPPGEALTERQIADLTEWVRRGAPWPSPQSALRNPKSAIGTHWSFRPPVTPPLPPVRNARWVQSPIDRFILAGLEAKKLSPAPAADRRTLIRRATFDLTGLPPTPEEVAAFLADRSPDAFARVVDRLLASPRYGERWGRHWLDVARYADSNGLDENLAFANAYRYRDTVIDAFNRDLPYNQFLTEQLAGDLFTDDVGVGRRITERAGVARMRIASNDVPSTTDVRSGTSSSDEGPLRNAPAHPDVIRKRIGTGFLALGGKMLAEDDPVKMEMDIVDEQVDTVGRTFMGLTLGCARCHDHKFDPISTADYYALAGIFKSTKTMENFSVVARWHENSLASVDEEERLRAHDQKIAAAKAAVEERRKALKEGTDEDATLRTLRSELRSLERARPVLPAAMGAAEGTVTNLRVHLRGSHLTLGDEVPRGFPRALAGEKQAPIGPDRSGRMELARWLTLPTHPLTSRVMVNRLWRWHFGAGLVKSVDNFGRLGDSPSHPELLDWLARRFVNGGWSIKAMHRLMMLSSTYQMSTAYEVRAARVDPENRLLWRMSRRRLEVEAIRDALLAVSGDLDTTMGGSLLTFKNRDYVTSTASRDETRYDHNRRSVYLPVIRSALYDVFQAFDFGDPSTPNGDRATTTVAPQALFMLNSTLVQQKTHRMATALLAEAGTDDDGRVRRAYEKALGRPPTNGERERALGFIRRLQGEWAVLGADEAERRTRAWQSFCRVLIASNEFVTLE